MRQKLISLSVSLLVLIAPAGAAIDPMTGPMYMGQNSGDLDQ
jgi:hypothetical protein